MSSYHRFLGFPRRCSCFVTSEKIASVGERLNSNELLKVLWVSLSVSKLSVSFSNFLLISSPLELSDTLTKPFLTFTEDRRLLELIPLWRWCISAVLVLLFAY